VTSQDSEATRTAAATQARRVGIAAMIQRVDRALQQMRRERAAITSAAVARRAGVSRSFLYQNADARALVTAAAAGHAREADARAGAPTPTTGTGPWRERALNAESELKRAHREIIAQRGRIGELLGRIRDLEHDLPEDGVARTINENHSLRVQVRQLTQDNRRLEERLAGARDTNRFLDKRIAELEAELADPQARREAN
jgi:chromosome segregation ATPase